MRVRTDMALTHSHMFGGMATAFEHVCRHCEMSAGHPSSPHESIRTGLSALQKRLKATEEEAISHRKRGREKFTHGKEAIYHTRDLKIEPAVR